MADTDPEKTPELAPELRDMKIEEGAPPEEEGESALDTVRVKVEGGHTPTPLHMPPRLKSRSKSQSPAKQQPSEASSPDTDAHEEVLGAEITLKMEPGKAPKLSRTASQKIVSRPPTLYLDLPDATEVAKETFVVLPECTYANKYLGTTEHALECDCSEEWDSVERVNRACGEDSDCINRATKMECVGDCGCGRNCQNQRFLQKQYANVTVIKTEKKGYGLRANANLKPGDFVFEYIGEVIDERAFRRRMVQYDEEGIKHFYFMSLTKGEFVDATKKGNLGRFCNHSCNPNCFVDKWVVGDKLRMGIFAERKIKAGEELVFNYNVDRYGADPQPCYCGEANCSGFIGGRTQTDNTTKLSHATIEALGIDDGEGWDTAVAKKPRRRKVADDDEEYVNDLQPKLLEEDATPKVLATLRNCSEKWIAVKLLDRIQKSRDEKVGHRVIRMHGYEILRKTITTWKDDSNVVLQVLDVLHKLPRITRNKIQDSKIEEVIRQLKDDCDDDRVITSANELLDAWGKLEIAYRIPRVKRDPNMATTVRAENRYERREKGRDRSRSRSKSPTVAAPSGAPSAPRGFNAPKQPAAFFNGPRHPARPRPHFNALPPGWFQTTSETGSTYYYNTTGDTQWQRPSLPANQPTPNPPKPKSDTQLLQDIIANITSQKPSSNQASASSTPQPAIDETKDKKTKSEKWRSLPQEKQEKLYEKTISKHVTDVTFRYSKELGKDDVKRLSKEVAKKLVRGDYKSGLVKDPLSISSKHEKKIKSFVKDYMDKAVKKKVDREKGKARQAGSKTNDIASKSSDSKTPETILDEVKTERLESEDEMLGLSDNDESGSHEVSPATELKRKREGDGDPGSPKKSRTSMPPAPPPPPPPPADDMPLDMDDPTFTPMEEDPASLYPANGEDMNGVAINGKARLLLDNIQLATPPTNASTEHDEYPNRRANIKRAAVVNGGS